MPSTARVFAHVMDWGMPPVPIDGTLLVRLEYSLLDGTRANGKFVFRSDPVINRDKLARDIIEALTAFLNTHMPGAQYRERDIVLW